MNFLKFNKNQIRSKAFPIVISLSYYSTSQSKFLAAISFKTQGRMVLIQPTQVFTYFRGGSRKTFKVLQKIYDRASLAKIVETINSVDTGRKLNVHETFRRRPGYLLNVLCTFSLHPVCTGFEAVNYFCKELHDRPLSGF